MGFLAGWMLNPWLFAAGGLLVAAPILIHLLNRRKFRIVDWAAMDFLLEADQRNRRRVQIEEMVLLGLRCLAMLLAGLLVARPFLPGSLARSLPGSSRTERIVVLDDSPSMEASTAGTSPFRTAKKRLAEFVSALAEQRSGDSLTLCLLSRPDRPVLQDVVVDDRTAPELVADIEALKASDLPARPNRVWNSLRGVIQGKSNRINHVVYVLSDLRRSDWTTDPGESGAAKDSRSTESPLVLLSRELAGCFLVDCGEGSTANLAITEIAPEDKALLSGVTARFQVTVRNFGTDSLRDVPVKFTAGGSLPLTASIDSLPAGGTGSVPFSFTFPTLASEDEVAPPVEMMAELDAGATDVFSADNRRYFAARVRSGIPTLIVDGDPSDEFGHSESFFLERALAPPGAFRSGIATQVIPESELATTRLEPWQAIYLCNVYQLDRTFVSSLERWVQAGGGLVLFAGGQVDRDFYNDALYREGRGLLPRPLRSMAGDDTEATWANLAVTHSEHPAVRIFAADAAPLLESAKIYQWWTTPESGNGEVLMRLNDAERTPLMIEQRFGRGRVVQVNLPADAEWSNWPEDASYVILLQELNRSLAQTASTPGQLTVGEPWSETLDLASYRPEAKLTRPDETTASLIAANQGTPGDPEWTVTVNDPELKGFYHLDLTTPDNQTHSRLAAANLAAGESDLARIDPTVLAASWEGAPISLVGPVELASLTSDSARGELWQAVLLVLALVLAAEQTLAWLFGRRR